LRVRISHLPSCGVGRTGGAAGCGVARPVPGSGSPAASRPAQGSPTAQPERALAIGAAATGPSIPAAPLSPPGSAGSSTPMTALIPPPAAAPSPGPPASPGAAAPSQPCRAGTSARADAIAPGGCAWPPACRPRRHVQQKPSTRRTRPTTPPCPGEREGSVVTEREREADGADAPTNEPSAQRLDRLPAALPGQLPPARTRSRRTRRPPLAAIRSRTYPRKPPSFPAARPGRRRRPCRRRILPLTRQLPAARFIRRAYSVTG
jgi:hypothetical protein